jgi:hypothetical protein
MTLSNTEQGFDNAININGFHYIYFHSCPYIHQNVRWTDLIDYTCTYIHHVDPSLLCPTDVGARAQPFDNLT